MTDSRKHIVGPTERREEIARIIEAWEGYPIDRHLRSLAKADAILASDGGREMVRELVEAIAPMANLYNNGSNMTMAFKRLAAIHAKAKEWLSQNKISADDTAAD